MQDSDSSKKEETKWKETCNGVIPMDVYFATSLFYIC